MGASNLCKHMNTEEYRKIAVIEDCSVAAIGCGAVRALLIF